MALAANPTKIHYPGPGGTSFPFPYPVTVASDLKVYKTDLTTEAITGSALLLGTDYNISGAGGSSCTVTLTSDLGQYGLFLTRVVPLTQGVVLDNSSAFAPKTHENEFDKLTQIDQQQDEALGRSLHVGSTDSSDTELPTLIPNYALVVNPAGDGFTLAPNSGADLLADLADTTLAVEGAGRIGFNAALSYAVGTVGEWLTRLKSSVGASLIGYIAPYTGAVARTQAAKNADWLSILDLGVLGNGTDEGVKIQVAVTAAANKILFWPYTAAGYKSSIEISLPTSIHIIGEPGATFYQTTLGLGGFIGTNSAGSTIEGLTILGPGSGTSTVEKGGITFSGTSCSNIRILNNKVSGFYSGIVAEYATDLWVEKNLVEHFKLYGILGSASSNFHINENNVKSCDQTGAAVAYGIMATGGGAGEAYPSKRCEIIGNIIDGITSWDGIMSHEASWITIDRNIITNCRSGVDIGNFGGSLDITDLIITRNTISLTNVDTWAGAPAYHTGIGVNGVSATLQYVDGVIISDNIIENANTVAGIAGSGPIPAAIQLDSLTNAIVHHNVIKNMGNVSASYPAISNYNPLDNVAITDNEIKGSSSGYGIYSWLPAGRTANNLRVSRNSYKTSGSPVALGVFNTGTYTNLIWTENVSSSGTNLYTTIGSPTITIAEGDGLWTPVLSFGGVSAGNVYGTQFGSFTKIGNKVFYNAQIILTTKNATAGSAIIMGLPYTASASQNVYPSEMYNRNVTFGGGQGKCYLAQSTMSLTPVEISGAGVESNVTNAMCSNTSWFTLSGWYLID